MTWWLVKMYITLCHFFHTGNTLNLLILHKLEIFNRKIYQCSSSSFLALFIEKIFEAQTGFKLSVSKDDLEFYTFPFLSSNTGFMVIHHHTRFYVVLGFKHMSSCIIH